MKEKHFGKCALCGKETELTFEHIPPRAAFNDKRTKSYDILSLIGEERGERMPWDVTGVHYTPLQKGHGKYSLCRGCNSLTGTWYGDEYKMWAYVLAKMLNNFDEKATGITLTKVHPMRFIKQVLSMMCSACEDDSDLDEIRDIVLNKEKKGLDKSKYKLCMYLTKGNMQKITGPMVIGCGENWEWIKLCEIVSPPIGFILYFNLPEGYEWKGIDITALADCEYDEETEVTFPIEVYEVNTPFPADFRTKEAVLKQIIENENIEAEREKYDQSNITWKSQQHNAAAG